MSLPPITKIEEVTSRTARHIRSAPAEADQISQAQELGFSVKPSPVKPTETTHIERLAYGSANNISASLAELSLLGKISLPVSFPALVTEGRSSDPLSKDRASGPAPRPTLMHLREAVSALAPQTTTGRIVKVVRDGVEVTTPPNGKLINSESSPSRESDSATSALHEESSLTSLIRGAKSLGLPHDMIIKIIALRIAKRVTNNDHTPELLNFLQDGVAKDENIRVLAGRLIEGVKQEPRGLIKLLCDSVQQATRDGLSMDRGFAMFVMRFVDFMGGIHESRLGKRQRSDRAGAATVLLANSDWRRAYQRLHFNEMQN